MSPNEQNPQETESKKHPYKIVLIATVILLLSFSGFFYALSVIKSKRPLSQQEIQLKLNADYAKNPMDFVNLSGALKRRSEMTENDLKIWEKEQHDFSRQNYKPDVVGASGDFFNINDLYLPASQVFSFRDISRYADLPIIRIEMVGGRFEIIRCKAEEFAAIMLKTRR
jgi:hypothetical protein